MTSKIFEPEQLRELTKLTPWKTYVAFVLDYALIGGTFAFAIHYYHPVVIFLLMPIIARTQLALAILMHDGAHKRLHPNPKWNDFFSQFLAAGPILFSAFSYRKNHLTHHKVPLTEEDPDLSLISGYPISRVSFLRKLLRDLSGISYFKFIRYFLYGSHKRAKNLKRNDSPRNKNKKLGYPLPLLIVSVLLPNALFFGILWEFNHPELYFFLWLLPSWTFLQLFLRIRGIAEHSGYQSTEDQALCSRTVVNPWQTFFVAPHNVNYHIEHHLFVGIPFYNLHKAHKIMKECSALPGQNVYKSYILVIKELVHSRSNIM